MATLSFADARSAVLREVSAGLPALVVETVDLADAMGRVLAADVRADRDYPPFDRSMRDGFAVRAAELPGELRLAGEVRAGQVFAGSVGPGECVEIMTGAPVPQGADAVVMVEHCTREAGGGVGISRSAEAGMNVAPRGSEARAGSVVLRRGTRLDHTGIACLASVGAFAVEVFRQPRVAILCTGDEIVEAGETPGAQQIRNSNLWALAAQVKRAGGVPVPLPVARDTKEQTRVLIERGLAEDLLLLSGGVSAGKYDVVEPVLEDLGATFYFDRVRIQPGQPLVFGKARERFFFGLPGNPASTILTFEVFARAAVQLLGGEEAASLPLAMARLTEPFRHKAGLTRFLPAFLECAEVTPVASKGSGDIPSLYRANAYLVADAEREEHQAGDFIPVLFK